MITIRSRPTRGVAPGSGGVLQRLVGAADHGRRPRLECFVDLRTEPVVLVARVGEHERIDRYALLL
jgi:hypothetical protein